MRSPLDLLQESFSLSLKMPAIIFTVVYIVIALLSTLAVAAIGAVIALAGIFVLALINNLTLNIIATIGALAVAAVILIILNAVFEIIFYKGLHQVSKKGSHDFSEIKGTIAKRIGPLIVFNVIVLVLVLLLSGIIAVPLYFLLNKIGIAIAVALIGFIVFLASPLFIIGVPLIILENEGALASLGITVRTGLTNYLFNITSIVLLIIVCFITVLISLIPILGWAIAFLVAIFEGIYLIRIYEENRQRAYRG